jgi:hypothetical protein
LPFLLFGGVGFQEFILDFARYLCIFIKLHTVHGASVGQLAFKRPTMVPWGEINCWYGAREIHATT